MFKKVLIKFVKKSMDWWAFEKKIKRKKWLKLKKSTKTSFELI
jgi:hypothetical protein